MFIKSMVLIPFVSTGYFLQDLTKEASQKTLRKQAEKAGNVHKVWLLYKLMYNNGLSEFIG